MDRAWQRVCRILAQLPEGKMEHPQVETANTSSCNTDRVYGAVTVAEVDNQVVFTVRLNGEYKANKVEVSLDKTQGILNISALDDSSSPTRSFTLSLEFGAESLKPLDVRSTRATLSGSLLTVVIPKRRDQSNLAQQSEMIPVLQIDSSATVKCPSRGSLPEVAADPFSAMLQREGRTGGPGLGGCPFRNGMMDVAKAGDMKSCPFSGRKSTAAQAQQCPFMRAQAAKDGNSHASTPDQCQAPAQPQPSKGMQSECPYVRDMAAQGKPIDPARASMCPAKRQQLQQSSCPYVRQKAQEGQPLDIIKAGECPAATSHMQHAAQPAVPAQQCPFMRAHPPKDLQSECPYVREMAAQGKPIDPARASMCPAKRQQLQQSSCPYVRQKAQEGQPLDMNKAAECPAATSRQPAVLAQQCPFMRAQPSKDLQSECPYVRDMAAQGKPIDPARASMCPAKRQQLQQSSCPYVRQKAQEGQPLDMNKAAECPAATSRSTQPAAATTTNMRSGCPFSSNYASASSSSSSVSSSVGRAPSACPFANSTRAPTGTCPFRRTGTEMTAALIITSKQL